MYREKSRNSKFLELRKISQKMINYWFWRDQKTSAGGSIFFPLFICFLGGLVRFFSPGFIDVIVKAL